MADDISFIVPGQSQVTPATGASLRGRSMGAVRVGARRGAGDNVRLVARDGEDVVVLTLANGPTLVLNPRHARDLMLAQAGAETRAGAADSDGAVPVPVQLGWAGLEAGTSHGAAAGATRGWLGQVLLEGFEVVKGLIVGNAAKITSAVVTQRLDGRVEAGVYELSSGELAPLKGSGRRRDQVAPAGDGAPLLVLVHGTFVDTVSTFTKLWTLHPQTTAALFAHYGQRVYALDHPTLTASPIANALTLVQALPHGARLHLLTHSRGGLVAEVLARACAAELDADELALFAGEGYEQHRKDLQDLVAQARAKQLRVERVLRVACPSRGTLLASGRLDAYLSVLKWGLGLAGLPVVAELVDFLHEVAQRRTEPTELPGLEAMTPDSPVVKWLNGGGEPLPGQLRVLAGDIEGDSIGSWVKTLLADAFYWTDNDLVVQTRSMYGGAARQQSGATFVLERGAKVSHFNYFANERSVQAVLSGLTDDAPVDFRLIGPLSWAGQDASGLRAAQAVARSRGPDRDGRAAADRPAVVVLPGILGSNLALDGKRIWLGLRLVGGLKKLAWDAAGAARVTPDGPVGWSYDDLIEHLAATHEVIVFAFDWRRPIEDEARRLAGVVDEALVRRTSSGQPVRLLAHSMGGLVARTMQLEAGDVWRRMMDRPGARLLMLGTPNAGSWAPMQVLSGDDTFGNTLVAFGGLFDDAGTRQVMAAMPGFIQLQAALTDPQLGLNSSERWQALADEDLRRLKEYSRWHSDTNQLNVYRWGAPPQAVLDQAVALRQRLDAQAGALGGALSGDAARMLLVVGHDRFTPDGYRIENQGLEYLDAADGDGRVPLHSALLPGVRTWRCDVAHGKLADASDAFAAYVELLQQGDTARLPQFDAQALRGAIADSAATPRVANRPSRARRASEPPSLPSQLFGRDEGRVPPAGGARLALSVVNGNLKFVNAPLLVGHYQSASLTGAERVVNLLSGGLMADALNAGRYPSEVGSAQVFANTRVDPEQPWALPQPAAVVVVGLGEEGRLRALDLQRSVRQGVIAYAQREKEQRGASSFELAATLVGSGGTGMQLGTAAQAIAQGVVDANRRLARTGWPQVSALQLIELYLDRATEAHGALRVLAQAHPQDFMLAPTIAARTGALRRPPDAGYRGAGYDFISVVQRRDAMQRALVEFTLDTQRARSEVRGLATQIRLVEEMVRSAADAASTDEQLRRSLFQLLVPPEIEPFLSGSTAVVLQLDKETARLPWELLDAGPDADGRAPADDRPWAVRTRMIRKLRTDVFRERPQGAGRDGGVLVIGEPLCDAKLFAALPAARDEATAVAKALATTALLAPDALRVVNALLAGPLRIVHIAGHGEPSDEGGGVVLSNDTLLGPREIGAMRTVPELVFVNCCFIGRIEAEAATAAPQHGLRGATRPLFAASVAEQLIQNGVRCVVAAGWAVEDVPASRFAVKFYERLLAGDRFIDAVGAARHAAWQANPRGNTWAAYQCYGDPDWRYAADADTAPSAAAGEVPALASAPALALLLENEAMDARYEIVPVDADVAKVRERCRRDRLTRLDRLSERYAPLWGGMGAVAEAFGLAYAESGATEQALAWYERAHAAADASASMRASEQLANLRARVGERSGDAAQVEQAIALLRQLLALHESAEVSSLLGSACKRLAMLQRRSRQPQAERESLVEAARAYERAAALAGAAGEAGTADSSDAHYALTNLAALQWLLAEPAQAAPVSLAELIEQARTALRARVSAAPDFWSMCGLVEMDLLEALAQGRLGAAQARVLEGFADLAQRVPAPHLWKSVLDQSRWLLQTQLDAGDEAALALVQQLATWAAQAAVAKPSKA